MQCPKCTTEMNELADLVFVAHRCNGCGGVWLGDADIDVQQHASAIDQIDTTPLDHDSQLNARRDINCPACNVRLLKMLDRTQLNIEYELCPDCRGAFFDAGELKDLSEFTLRERLNQLWDTLKSNLN